MRSSKETIKGMSIGQALCTIEITYSDPGDADRETSGHFKRAAHKLVKECVMNQGRGGIVKGLG